MKVALVHYWLVGMRGGERVLESLCNLYPDADIYTHVIDPKKISPVLLRHRIYTSLISKLPFAKRLYKKYLPFMPFALEQLDLTAYDLVISSESGPAKGVITRPDSVHICYCHSPMRYVWDHYHVYLDEAGWLVGSLMRPIIHYLRAWDYLSAARVDHFIANSNFVRQRIKKFYRRDAEIISPPVAISDFHLADQNGDFYLLVGQLVSYKRADLAVEAFNALGLRLIVVGEGDQLSRLQRSAQSNVEFLGWQPFTEIQRMYGECKALIFPGIEDFGIVPLEAMASGRPVIAYAAGGALETVKEGETGLFFREHTAASLQVSVERFEQGEYEFDSLKLREWAEGFSNVRFERQISSFVEKRCKEVFAM